MSFASAAEPHADQITSIGVLHQDAFGGPATVESVVNYNMNLDAFEFYADVDQLTIALYPDGDLPQVTIIDTSVMEIVYKATNYEEELILDTANAL